MHTQVSAVLIYCTKCNSGIKMACEMLGDIFCLVVFFQVCGDMLEIDFKSLEIPFYHLWNSCMCSCNELFLLKLIFRLKINFKSHLRNSENQELSSKVIFSCAPLSVILWLSVVFDFGNTVFNITLSGKKEGIVWGSFFYF